MEVPSQKKEETNMPSHQGKKVTRLREEVTS